LELERYSASIGAVDDIEAFLTAVETHRQATAACAAPTTAKT
jgi:hypothetical protein